MSRLVLAILFAIGFATAKPAQACKYSVRDVGFVPMKNVDYELVFFAGPNDDGTRLERLAKDAFKDSNVGFSIIDPAKAEEPDLKRLVRPTPPLRLLGPNGRSSSVPWNIKEGSADLASIVDSPTRRDIARRLPNAFAVFVLVEGDDRDENRRARATVDQVVDQVTQVLARGKLEKGAKEGPTVVVIPAADRERERWLIWSLGIDDPTRASAAFVFGQFRRSAKLFTGAEIDAAKMFSPLATLGFSCECDLDRAKLFGPALPHVWTNDDRKRTIAAVEFEPEAANVRAEVNAILAKKARIEPLELDLKYESLLLGLKETPLDEEDPVRPPAPKSQPKAAAPRAVAPALGPGEASVSSASAKDADDVRTRGTRSIALAAVVLFGFVILACCASAVRRRT